MNKEDVLTLSRQENQNGDEREEKIKLRSYAMSAAIGALLCMILVFIEDMIYNRSTTSLWIIYCGMMFSKNIIDAVKLKKKLEIVLAILWGICLVINSVFYILDNIK